MDPRVLSQQSDDTTVSEEDPLYCDEDLGLGDGNQPGLSGSSSSGDDVDSDDEEEEWALMARFAEEVKAGNDAFARVKLPGEAVYRCVTNDTLVLNMGWRWNLPGDAVCLAQSYLVRLEAMGYGRPMNNECAVATCLFIAAKMGGTAVTMADYQAMLCEALGYHVDVRGAQETELFYVKTLKWSLSPVF